MKKAQSFLIVLLLAGASSPALAQRGYHGGHFGRPAVDPQQKIKIHATDEQRTQLETCLAVSERLRSLAADLRKRDNLSESEWVKAHRRWNEVLSQAMQSHHKTFLKSLNADQQAALKDHLQKMDKTWSELSSRFGTVDHDLAEAAPDAKYVPAHAKALEKSLKKFHKQHRELGSEIGIEG